MGERGLKRAANGSAFTTCDNCKKSIPLATADMHECGADEATKALLKERASRAAAAPEATDKKPKAAAKNKKTKASGDDKPKAKRAKKDSTAAAASKPKVKRAATAFFLFMADFRKQLKDDKTANAKGSEVAKLGGERWRAMSDEEKAPYLKQHAELKAELNGGKKDDAEDDNEDGGSDKKEEQDDEEEAEEEAEDEN